MSLVIWGNNPLRNLSYTGPRPQGSAYVFRSLDTATGTTTQNATLSITNFVGQNGGSGGAPPNFGYSVSISGNQGFVGAWGMDNPFGPGGSTSGAADVGTYFRFPGLDTATGINSVNMNGGGGSGQQGDQLGASVSHSGSIALIGRPRQNYDPGGTVIVHRDGEGRVATLNGINAGASAFFGNSVSVSGNIGLVGAPYASVSSRPVGAVYVFHNLNTVRSSHTGFVRLTTPYHPRLFYGGFGTSVSVSGSIGLVGSFRESGGTSNSVKLDQGAAYVFRGLDTATASITSENVRLTASDGAAGDYFGISVSLSGSTGLVGADGRGVSGGRGSAYLFRNLDTATGNITQNVKLTASDGALGAFGTSVSLDGDQFLIGDPQRTPTGA